MNNQIWDVLKDVQLFKAQSRIPPGSRKNTEGRHRFVVSSFVGSLFCFFVVRCVVVLSFYPWVAPPADEEIYQNPLQIM